VSRLDVDCDYHGRLSSRVLIGYRVSGGPANVDQRLTVFEDGTAELDERHRSRDTIRLQISAADLDRLRGAIATLPPDRWSRPPRAALRRIGAIFLPSVPGHRASGARFELRRGRRAIVGGPGDDPELAPMIDALDTLRVEAVRAVPR
jgi:hypothetical protein